MNIKNNATAKHSEALIRTLNATAKKTEALFNSSYPKVIAFRSLTPPPPKQPPKTGNIPETAQAPGTHKNVVPTPNSCLPNMGSQFVCGPKCKTVWGDKNINKQKTHTQTCAHISVACACLLMTSDHKRSLSHEGHPSTDRKRVLKS